MTDSIDPLNRATTFIARSTSGESEATVRRRLNALERARSEALRQYGDGAPLRWTMIEQVAELPVATADMIGRIMLVRNTQYDDTVNVCIAAPDGTPYWYSVNLNEFTYGTRYSFGRKFGSGTLSGVAWFADAFLLVVQAGSNRVALFNAAGTQLTTFGSAGTGNGQFSTPRRVHVDASGYVYVSDATRVQMFTSAFAWVRTMAAATSPRGMSEYGGSLYVADSGAHAIRIYATIDGTQGGIFGTQGSGPEQFSAPEGVAVDAAGNVYVADTGNHRICKHDANGTFVAAFGRYGNAEGQFIEPCDVTPLGGGNIAVVDRGNHRVQVLAPNGAVLSSFGYFGSQDGQFNQPVAVAAGPGNDLAVVDATNARVQVWQPVEAYVGPAGPQGPQGPQGAVAAITVQADLATVAVSDVLNFVSAGGVTVTGDDPTDTIEISLPAGPTGPAGPAGAASTVTGPTGPQGAQGPSGPQGATGAASTVAGPQGPQGPFGAQGPSGPQGVTGSLGPQGPSGPQGAAGPQGATGSQGPQGALGPQGPSGPQGATGPGGPQGAVGPQGASGATGPTGAASTVAGPQGPQGPTGAQGPAGPQGADSTVPGPTGATGPAGSGDPLSELLLIGA